VVAVRLSQQKQPHHCHDTGKMMTAATSAACSFATAQNSVFCVRMLPRAPGFGRKYSAI
jgi:hypothetical protein